MIEDYNLYKYSLNEKTKYCFFALVGVVIVAYLLYENIVGAIILLPFSFILFKKNKEKLVENRKWQLNLEFKDGIESLMAGLNAGSSIEQAMAGALEDLKRIYKKEDLIVREFTHAVNRIKLNQNIEDVMIDFGRRSQVEDIINFADVLLSAKRTDGNLIRIIDYTCGTIGDKIEMEREIKTLYSAKKFEANIMRIMPSGILLYLKFFSPGYMDPLYGNLLGVLVMTILFITYIGVWFLVEKIMDIEV